MAKTKRKPKKKALTARNADKHILYQESVQDAEVEVDFITRVYKRIRKRSAKSLREDFCGTALVCAEWINRSKDKTAVGVDLDKPTLDWATKNNLSKYDEPGNRVKLLRQNVLKETKEKFDVIDAMNFSYFIFKERKVLKDYFTAVYRSLNKDGVFFTDCYGGTEAGEELEEDRDQEGFTYVWDQHSFNPINNHVLNYIHFEFPDGSKIRKAFTYDWRLWSLAEIQEIMYEAGFKLVEVYWEDDDPDGEEGNGVFRRRKNAENCEGWIAYVVATK